LLVELVCKKAPGEATIEDGVDVTVGIKSVAVHMQEIDDGKSPNRQHCETESFHRNVRESKKTALAYYLAAVAHSGRRFLFWQIPFDLLRGLLRRFSGHSTAFLFGTEQNHVASGGDSITHFKFVSVVSDGDCAHFSAIHHENIAESDNQHQILQLRMLAISRKACVWRFDLSVCADFIGITRHNTDSIISSAHCCFCSEW
jgi:hypothetical protein